MFCRINKLVGRIHDDLNQLINEASAKDEIETKYRSQIFHLEPVHGEDVLEEAIQKLEPIFQRRVRAVEVDI